MPRFTTAYSDYIVRTAEVDILVRRATKLERAAPVANTDEIRALCRAATVLLCSHLEGYVKDLGEVTVDRLYGSAVPRDRLGERFFYSISKNHFDEMRDTADPAKLATKMFAFLDQDSHFWSRTGPFPNPVPYDRFSAGFASPSVDKVCAFLGRFGAGNLKKDLMRTLAADWAPVSNMVENVVATRNSIAHGDSLVSKTPGDVAQMLIIVKQFVKAVDGAFGGWCRSNLCPIR